MSSDYLNPDREEPETVDYDNPPVINQVMPMNNETSDYDNPPAIQGNSPPMGTHRIGNSNTESSDYDNPPIQGNSIHSHNNLNTESSDYDNPPIQDISQDVPGSSQDAVTEPEYLELEPEDSSL